MNKGKIILLVLAVVCVGLYQIDTGISKDQVTKSGGAVGDPTLTFEQYSEGLANAYEMPAVTPEQQSARLDAIRNAAKAIYPELKRELSQDELSSLQTVRDRNAEIEKERVFEAKKSELITAASQNKSKNDKSGVVRTQSAMMEADDFEPDNSHNQGEKLIDGFVATKHNIYPAGDVDFFYFYGEAGDIIEITVKTENPFWSSNQDPYQLLPPSEADLDPFVTLYLPDKSVLVNDDDSGTGWDSYINIQLPVTGEYFISVESSPLWAPNLTTGGYDLAVAFLKVDGFEPDDVMANAHLLNDGDIRDGHTILPAGDVDFFKFDITVPGTALHALVVNSASARNVSTLNFPVVLDNPGEIYKADLDPMVTVFDAGGNFLYQMDDTNNPWNPAIGNNDVELAFSFPDVGTYYVAVEASPKGNGNTLVGSYVLSFDLVLPDAYEPDNIPPLANPIAYGQTIGDHTITSVLDGDMFVFKGKKGDYVDIYVASSNPCADLDPGVALFADGGVGNGTWGPWPLDWLHSSMDDGVGLDAHIIWGPLPYAGNYYIEVGADPLSWFNWWERSGAYSITLKKVEKQPFTKKNALELEYCTTVTGVIPRTGEVWPDDKDVTTKPNWFKFEGVEGEVVSAKVVTPVQYRGKCGTMQSDWMDDLNPQVTITDSDGTKLGMNKNINPMNQWDDAQVTLTLPYTGVYFVKVEAEIVTEGPLFEFFGKSDSYGEYSLTLQKAPSMTDFDSDKNVGFAPMSVNFFSKCTDWEDPCTESFLWHLMYGYHKGGIEATGQEPSNCYWTLGMHDVEKKAFNQAGFAQAIKEDFITIYGPSGYAPMALMEGSESHEKEPWENAVDGDTYWWSGVATVKGMPPWAIFNFQDGKTKLVNKVRILADAGVGMEERWVKKFTVEASVNGMDFSPVMTGKLANGGWHDFMIDPPVEAKYVKLKVDEPMHNGWVQVAEFEVYEDIVVPSMEKSTLTATTPHIANGSDASLLTLKLIDDAGNPITVYDEMDIHFYLIGCVGGDFGPIDLSERDMGIYKATLTSKEPGGLGVVAVAHGAIVLYDWDDNFAKPTVVDFFGGAADKGPMIVVEGSETFEGEGWENAVDGDKDGWDGTVTAKNVDPCYAIFKFANDKRMPFNKIGLMTDNGFADDAVEHRQVSDFQVLISDDMVTWTTVLNVKNRNKGSYVRYNLGGTKWAKYVQLVLLKPNWTPWRQIVEFDVVFDGGSLMSENGTNEIAAVEAIPTTFDMGNNYPNPFNPTTTISYQVPQSSNVTLKVYNTIGQEVATLVDGFVEAGYHSVTWSALDVPSGIYIYRFTAGSFSKTNRMILLK